MCSGYVIRFSDCFPLFSVTCCEPSNQACQTPTPVTQHAAASLMFFQKNIFVTALTDITFSRRLRTILHGETATTFFSTQLRLLDRYFNIHLAVNNKVLLPIMNFPTLDMMEVAPRYRIAICLHQTIPNLSTVLQPPSYQGSFHLISPFFLFFRGASLPEDSRADFLASLDVL